MSAGLRQIAAQATLSVLLVLTGCSTGSSGTPQGAASTPAPATTATVAPTTPAPTTDPAPVDGACYDLTPAQLDDAHTSVAPTPCRDRHSTQTYLVTTLDRSTIGDPLSIDSAAIVAAAEATCSKALRTHLGSTRDRLALSRFVSAWFVPQESQFALGARWLRCDVASRATDSTLSVLPRRSGDLLSSDAALDRWGTCARTRGDALQSGKGQRVCSKRHNWRAVRLRRLGSRSAPWPGEAAVRKGVLKRCEKAGRVFTANTTGSIDVGWLPPTKGQWQSGRRFGLCWVRTS